MPSKTSTSSAEELSSLSRHKREYLDIETSALVDGAVSGSDVRLGDFLDGSSRLAILFYPADFSPGPREEILELIAKKDRFEEKGCKVFTCSTDSAQVHLAWQNTKASEEADGLGVQTSFHMLGDKTQRLCRALEVLDEDSGLAYHALVLIDPNGEVVFKETASDGGGLQIESLFPILDGAEASGGIITNGHSNGKADDASSHSSGIEKNGDDEGKADEEGAGEPKAELEAQVSFPMADAVDKLKARLSYAVESEVEEHHEEMVEAVEVVEVDRVDGGGDDAASKKTSVASSRATGPEIIANAATLESDLKKDLEEAKVGSEALTLANASEKATEKRTDNHAAKTTTTSEMAAAKKTAGTSGGAGKGVPVTANKQQKPKKKKCCVVS